MIEADEKRRTDLEKALNEALLVGQGDLLSFRTIGCRDSASRSRNSGPKRSRDLSKQGREMMTCRYFELPRLKLSLSTEGEQARIDWLHKELAEARAKLPKETRKRRR